MLMDGCHNIIGKVRSRIRHGHDNSFYGKIRVARFPNTINGLDELGDPFQGVEFTLDGNQYWVCRCKGIDSQ